MRDPGGFWYGSEKLWVQLSESGRWNGLYRAEQTVYRNKFPLYRAGFDVRREPTPPMVVAAKRIGAVGQVVVAETTRGIVDDTNSYMMTAFDLPVGCWQIAAQYANEPPLTFVVSVP